MSNRNRTFLKFTLIEWVVAVLILLIVARFIWAEEVAGFEDRLFVSIGRGGGAKYLITVPLAIGYLYWLFRREQLKAQEKGQKVVRPQVLVVSLGVLVLAIVFMFLSAS